MRHQQANKYFPIKIPEEKREIRRKIKEIIAEYFKVWNRYGHEVL